MGMAIQQTGYQVGDFLVQVQGGTNWMVAFGQQATQLVGILPAMGAGFMGLSMGALIALSAGLGIAIPLVTAIGAAFMRTSKDAKAGAKEIDTYAEAIQSLTSEIQKNQEAFLQAKFGTESSGIAKSSQELEELGKEIVKVEAQIDAFYKALYQTTGTQGTAGGLLAVGMVLKDALLGDGADPLKERLASLEAMRSTLLDQQEAQRMLNGGLSVAAGIQKGLVYDKQLELNAAKELAQAHASQVSIMGRTKEEAEALAEASSRAGVSAQQLSHLDFSNISTAASEALRLAGNLGISLETASALAALGPQGIGGNDPSGETYSGRGQLDQSDITGLRVAGTFGYKTPPDDKKKRGGDKRDPLEELRKQIELENELLGVSESQARVLQALGQDRGKYSKTEIDAITAEIEAYNLKQEAIERTKAIMETVNSSMENGFMAMVEGTKSVKDAFKTMAYDIVKELYRVLVVQRLVGAISGGFGMFTGSSTGSLGLPFGLATGGSMMPNQPYLVGEHGPELVIPRHSGTVVNANQTAGVMSESGGFTQNLSINVSGSDAAMVRTEIAKMIPQITNATKSAMIDAKQRGGQMAQAFR
jgi:hypothetical protein